jgi:WD40 repeat protein
VLVAVVVGIGVLPATGATGDTVITIFADRTGTACADSGPPGYSIPGYWTGIAFDGTNLVLSCHGDANLVFVKPTDGSQVRILAVIGGADLGAMAFDGKTSTLWVCSGEDVGTIDVTSGQYTKAFTTSTGCLDGLAFDGSDSTLWASGDADTTVKHYSLAGAELGSFTVNLNGRGNSGLAVGGSSLFLGNNGGAQIFQSSKDLTAPTLFIDTDKTEGRRVEDLECDNLTFAAQGQPVIWAQDAYDNIIKAYEIPEGNCFFGGGVTPTTEPPATDPPSSAPPAATAAAATSPKFTG